MQIIQLSHVGTDTVTFWTAPDKPMGCLIQFDNHPLAYAVAALTRKPGDPAEIGLLPLDQNLYRYLVQELQGRTLIDVDIDLVSNEREIFGLIHSGGIGKANPEVVEALNALEARMGEPDIGDEIAKLILARQRNPWLGRF